MRRALREMVAGLKAKWSEAVLASVLETELNAIEDQVRAHLKKRYPCCTMSRLFGRWRKGLLYVCSHRNEAKYKSAHMAVSGTYRLIEMETNMHREKSRAIHPGKTFAKNRECNGMRQRAANQSKLAAQLLASIQTTRAQQEIRTEEEVEIANILNVKHGKYSIVYSRMPESNPIKTIFPVNASLESLHSFF